MEQVIMHLEIRPDAEAEYEQRHEEIWPEMVDAIKASGIAELRIFRHDLQISIYAKCEPSADVAFAKLGETEINTRWNEHMADLLVDRSAAIFSPEIWSMS